MSLPHSPTRSPALQHARVHEGVDAAAARRPRPAPHIGVGLLGLLLALPAAADPMRISGPDDDHHFGDVGNALSEACRLSRNGRFVLFASQANNLVPGDDNRERDLFLRDRLQQTTVRVNRGVGEADGALVGRQHDLSGDGRRIVFVSEDLLGSATPNGMAQVLLLDRGDGSVRLVSRAVDGSPIPGTVDHPRISADGSHVVFTASGGELVAGIFSLSPQVYRYEVATGAIDLVSQSAGGAMANGGSSQPTVSGDGSRVAFATDADNLLTDAAGTAVADVNGEMDAVFKTYPSGRVRLAGVTAAGAALAGGASDAAIAADGLSIAFTSNDAALRSDPANDDTQIYVRRLGAGATTQAVSVDAAGAMADGPARDPEISDDGRWVAYLANAPNLGGALVGNPDVVLRDTAAALTRAVGVQSSTGATALSGDGASVCKQTLYTESEFDDRNSASDILVFGTNGGSDIDVASVAAVPTTWAGGDTPTMSADGATVVFATRAANIVADMPGTRRDLGNLVRYDVATGIRTLLLPALDGTPLVSSFMRPVLSADGTQLFFQTTDARLAVSDSTIARLHLGDGSLLHVTPSSDAAGLDAPITSTRSSGDGRAAVFVSAASNLPGAPTLPPELVHLWREGIGTQVVSRVPGGAFADANSEAAAISRDGRCVAFASAATTLATPALAGSHVYLYRVDDDTLARIDDDTDASEPTRIVLDATCSTLFVLRADTVPRGGGNVRLQRYDIAAGRWTEIATGLDLAADLLAVSGDGRHLAVEDDAPLGRVQLWRVDAETGATRAITPIAEPFFGAALGISDDGARVVLESDDDALDPQVVDDNGDTDVYLVAVAPDAVFGDGFE